MKNILKYLFLLTAFQSFGQELSVPVFTQYLADNDFVLSPTFAGIGNNFRTRIFNKDFCRGPRIHDNARKKRWRT